MPHYARGAAHLRVTAGQGHRWWRMRQTGRPRSVLARAGRYGIGSVVTSRASPATFARGPWLRPPHSLRSNGWPPPSGPSAGSLRTRCRACGRCSCNGVATTARLSLDVDVDAELFLRISKQRARRALSRWTGARRRVRGRTVGGRMGHADRTARVDLRKWRRHDPDSGCRMLSPC